MRQLLVEALAHVGFERYEKQGAVEQLAQSFHSARQWSGTQLRAKVLSTQSTFNVEQCNLFDQLQVHTIYERESSHATERERERE
jgi:hypothetical protein